ncbi:hypothetical protein VTO42DRAFT_1413 [Malbranchea cinnamomea]
MWVRRSKTDMEKVQVFAVSLADIDKALKPKSYTDSRTKLPKHYHQFLDVFDRKRAETLPPLRGEGVDHRIELTEDKAKVPWGPLYQSSREELLVLRKELNSLLDKGFIRVSNSPAAASVLFVKKPGGGLRFCLDIIAAFHKIQYLDEFVSTYIDDILIFTTGSLHKHRQHVEKVLLKLQQARLQADIDKCEFEVKSTKYLGFIIEVAPSSMKGVRAFLGFANFYRRFIKIFSEIVALLVALTQKDTKFIWSESANDAFEKLKQMFVWALSFANLTQIWKLFWKHTLLVMLRTHLRNESELKSVRDFLMLTDHKNLTYFTTTKKLNECQICWQEFLSQFNFRIKYKPGCEGTLSDVLSRFEQNMPQDADDRFVHREACLLKPEVFVNTRHLACVNYLRVATPPLYAKPATADATLDPSEWQELKALWKTVELNNPQW